MASVVTERNGTIAWVCNGAILYAFAGLQTLQSLHFCKVFCVVGKHTDCVMEWCGGYRGMERRHYSCWLIRL